MKINNGGTHYVLAMLFSLAALALGCFAAFAVFIKGPEEVMVPDVVGKTLEDALMLMQDKELYARLVMRHSTEKDRGLVLEQTPAAGSIRKGYSRVSLVVSDGPVVGEVADYIGMTLDEVRLSVAAQFAGEPKPLIVIGQPMYKIDSAPIGTVLEQEPAAGTAVNSTVTVNLVVSRGTGSDTVSPPNLKGFSLDALLNAVSSLPLLFDYTSQVPQGDEAAGTVVSMEGANAAVNLWSRIKVVLAMPAGEVDGKVYGILKTWTDAYPVAVKMRLVAVADTEDEEAIDAQEIGGNERDEGVTIASFMHTGGQVTVPYCVAPGTVLELYAQDTLCAKMKVKGE